MDKSVLVNQIDSFIQHLQADGIELDFAALIPSHTFYKNDLYVIVLSIPTLSSMTSGTMNGLIIDKWFAFTTQEERRHISTVLSFSTINVAQRYIDSQDVDEFVIPILETRPRLTTTLWPKKPTCFRGSAFLWGTQSVVLIVRPVFNYRNSSC